MKTTQRVRVAFLDRDGTIIHDANYLSKKEDIKLFSDSAEAIKKLNDNNILVIVITNQSGIARGFFAEDSVFEIHNELQKMLNLKGAKVDAFYYCPHHKNGTVEKYTKECRCRKPKIGMLEMAKKDFARKGFDIDLSNSFVVGDKPADVNLAKNAGCKSILVKTGYGKESIIKCEPDFIAEDLKGAVDRFILG